MLGSEAETMHRVLEHIRADHGTVTAWLHGVGVEEPAIATLAVALLDG